jgi:hypothetical protein
MPGAFTARSVRAPDRHTGFSAIGEAAIALQLMPGYLQAPDRGGHPLRWRGIIAGQSSALKAGTAGQLADFCPLAAARALIRGAEGNLSCDMAPDRLVPSMTASDSIPVT